jgi:hypothetical protein
MDEQLTPELGRQMLARRLIAEHAASRGFAGQANWAHWQLHNQYLALPQAARQCKSFSEYVIEELSR